MRFGRTGCVAVLKHFNEWIAQNDADPDVSRNQIAYAKVAKDLWFSSPKHRVLQDLWNNRVKNKDPTRGCLRKVISMVVMVGSDIRLKRKKKWFCEARRHAGKHSHMLSRHSQLYDDREIGDRNELVLFSSPGDQSELDVVFESVYSEASKLFTNNRTKDQAVILAAFLQKLCYYPVRGIHSANWLGRKKKELKKEAELMDREVRQHLLRPQLGSRKRKAELAFPENRSKIGRLDMMSNYVNPMSGLVHRHALQMSLDTTHSAMDKLKNAMILGNSLPKNQFPRDGTKQSPLTSMSSNMSDFDPVPARAGEDSSLPGVQKSPKLTLSKTLDQTVDKDTKIVPPEALDTKRQKLLREQTDKSQMMLAKQFRPQRLGPLTMSNLSFPLTPPNYLDMGMRPYFMYSSPARGIHPLRLSTGPITPYMSYVHPISLALGNPEYKALTTRDVSGDSSRFYK